METQIYKVRLEEMLEEITTELKAVGIHNPQNPSDWVAVPDTTELDEPDPDLVADAVEDWNERAALVATLESRYNSIKGALARIASNTFGECEVCGAAIEPNRLEANPIARTCIAHIDQESTL